jgi:hypothetical protein
MQTGAMMDEFNARSIVKVSAKSLFVACAFMVLTCAVAAAMEAPSLKQIMQDLRDDLVEITDGLLVNDFNRIEQGASGIAGHDRIPASQVARVAEELGPEMAAFKLMDEQVHELSLSIMKAAREQDRGAVTVSYQRMVEGCLACHDAYKNRVSEVLNKAPE